MMFPRVTELQGSFGGGEHPLVPVTIRILDFSLPDGHCRIGGQLYRMVYDPEILAGITYPDGSKPTACAFVPVYNGDAE